MGAEAASKKRLRPVSKPSVRLSPGLVKLRALDLFEEVDLRVRKGWPLRQIARYLQDDKGLMNDYSFKGLVNILAEHRDSIPAVELANEALTERQTKAAREVERGMDEIDEMEDLYRMQMRRIRQGALAEDTANFLNKNMPQEVREALRILSARAQLKMDLGVGSRRQLGEVHVSHALNQIGERYGSGVQEVLSDPQRAGKVISLFNRLTSNREVIDVEPVED